MRHVVGEPLVQPRGRERGEHLRAGEQDVRGAEVADRVGPPAGVAREREEVGGDPVAAGDERERRHAVGVGPGHGAVAARAGGW